MKLAFVSRIVGLVATLSFAARAQLAQPFEPRPLPLLPPGTAPAATPPATASVALRATATFEPSVLPLMRFGEYRVTISGASSGIELPDVLPAPDGLILDLTDKTPGSIMVNGVAVKTMTFRYSATASRPGRFVVPSYAAKVGSRIVMVPAAQLVAQEPSQSDPVYQPVQAVLDVPTGEYYVGQMIPGRLLVFDSPNETVQAIANVTKPSGDFLFQSQPGARRDTVMWQGRPRAALVTPLRLTPIKAGESDLMVQAIVFVNRLNLIGRSSGNSGQSILDTPFVHVKVKSLPEQGRKPGFTGAIGRFRIGSTSLSSAEVMVGDPVTLSLILEGEGNLESFSAPQLSFGPAWQTFPPTVEVSRTTFSGAGQKKLTYTLIPRSADVREIPSIPFSYFDPERKQYIDLPVPPAAITVLPDKNSMEPEPGTAKASSPSPTPEPAKEAKSAAPVFSGFVEGTGSWRWSPAPIAWSPWFWAGQLLPAFSLLGLWAWRLRSEYLVAHPEVVRRWAARKAARKHLRLARTAVAHRDLDRFVTASIDAIRAATAPLNTTQAESLVRQEVLTQVPAQAAGEEVIRKLYERAHARRFSGRPVGPGSEWDLLPEVERTVAAIEVHQP